MNYVDFLQDNDSIKSLSLIINIRNWAIFHFKALPLSGDIFRKLGHILVLIFLGPLEQVDILEIFSYTFQNY